MCVSLCLGPLPDSEEETLADTGVNHDGTDVEFPEADATQRTPSAGDLGDGGGGLGCVGAGPQTASAHVLQS